MASIDEFERQVFKQEGIRIVLRHHDSDFCNLVAYPQANHRLPDTTTVRSFRKVIEHHLGNDLPFVIIGGNGLKPQLTVTLGEVRATYTPRPSKLKKLGKVEGDPIARALLAKTDEKRNPPKLSRNKRNIMLLSALAVQPRDRR
jgi:hypothetical protein